MEENNGSYRKLEIIYYRMMGLVPIFVRKAGRMSIHIAVKLLELTIYGVIILKAFISVLISLNVKLSYRKYGLVKHVFTVHNTNLVEGIGDMCVHHIEQDCVILKKILDIVGGKFMLYTDKTVYSLSNPGEFIFEPPNYVGTLDTGNRKAMIINKNELKGDEVQLMKILKDKKYLKRDLDGTGNVKESNPLKTVTFSEHVEIHFISTLQYSFEHKQKLIEI